MFDASNWYSTKGNLHDVHVYMYVVRFVAFNKPSLSLVVFEHC